MNKARRKRLEGLYDELVIFSDKIEGLRDEEQLCLDAMPESFEYTERYEAMEEAIDNLDYAISSIEEALSYIESAKE